jgi:hypothetical protein
MRLERRRGHARALDRAAGARRGDCGGSGPGGVARALDLEHHQGRAHGGHDPGLAVGLGDHAGDGEVSSTVALSVITSTRSWSSSTRSPTFTCQAVISASAVPSPTSGSLKT